MVYCFSEPARDSFRSLRFFKTGGGVAEVEGSPVAPAGNCADFGATPGNDAARRGGVGAWIAGRGGLVFGTEAAGGVDDRAGGRGPDVAMEVVSGWAPVEGARGQSRSSVRPLAGPDAAVGCG